ncbi:hypothetical protein C8J57DRAFT_1578787 [Mycena rebaudengoi]|nr:hypothetical protein C8J57DRAFT_1578787 [Mycena rebaudengoi]
MAESQSFNSWSGTEENPPVEASANLQFACLRAPTPVPPPPSQPVLKDLDHMYLPQQLEFSAEFAEELRKAVACAPPEVLRLGGNPAYNMLLHDHRQLLQAHTYLQPLLITNERVANCAVQQAAASGALPPPSALRLVHPSSSSSSTRASTSVRSSGFSVSVPCSSLSVRPGSSSAACTPAAYLVPFANRANCPVTHLLYLVFQDQVFTDITTIEELLFPTVAPTAIHKLAIRPEHLSTPVLRAEVFDHDLNAFIISPTQALRSPIHGEYEYLRRLTTLVGYIIERDLWVKFPTHASLHLTMQQDCTIFHERDQDTEKLALAKRIASAAVGRDSDAPTSLTVAQQAELLAEPELVSLRVRRADLAYLLQLKVATHKLALASLDPDSEDPQVIEDFANLHSTIRRLMREGCEIQSTHDLIFNRESVARVRKAQATFHARSSGRQLRGEAAPSAPTMALARKPLADKTRNVVLAPETYVITSLGKENHTPSSTFALSSLCIDPIMDLIDILYRFATPNISDQVAPAVNALLGLPQRPFPVCYPNESPNADNCCPVCKHSCFSGSHIHNCITSRQQQHIQEYVESEYTPEPCQWDGCKQFDYAFKSRDVFIEHVETRTGSLALPTTKKNPTRHCRWRLEDGEMCIEDHADDWYNHFGLVHSNSITVPSARSGTSMSWVMGSCGKHPHIVFAPFRKRVEGDVDHTPIGISYVDNCIEYEVGSGFNELLAEFHGYVVHGVALVSNSTLKDGRSSRASSSASSSATAGSTSTLSPAWSPRRQLTYNTTLVELTSLEEMMRIMMDDDQIHPDVIVKLWSVYGANKQLPKEQRRGAIIILRMLALAKRGVLTDHVDVMLKHLDGSAKKIKDSLLDKTIRIEIENPIFRRLQEAVEQPTRSRDWFGLAEQAINTTCCAALIKKLTVCAFTPRPKAQAEEGEGEKDADAMDEDHPGDVSCGSEDSGAAPKAAVSNDVGDAFELSPCKQFRRPTYELHSLASLRASSASRASSAASSSTARPSSSAPRSSFASASQITSSAPRPSSSRASSASSLRSSAAVSSSSLRPSSSASRIIRVPQRQFASSSRASSDRSSVTTLLWFPTQARHQSYAPRPFRWLPQLALGRLPGEQRNNVVRSSFVLGTPGFILSSLRKLIIHPALLVDSGGLIILRQLTPAVANTPTTPAAANTPAATVQYRREYD